MDNRLSMTFADPIRRRATEAIALMLRNVGDGTAPAKRMLSFEMNGPENI
jgi:hypothetical protein